jgi:hypothetical protein
MKLVEVEAKLPLRVERQYNKFSNILDSISILYQNMSTICKNAAIDYSTIDCVVNEDKCVLSLKQNFDKKQIQAITKYATAKFSGQFKYTKSKKELKMEVRVFGKGNIIVILRADLFAMIL